MKRILVPIMILVLTLVAMPKKALAKEKSKIYGIVKNFDNDPVSGVKIRLLNSDFSEAYSTTSNSEGNYELSEVKKGNYLALVVIKDEEYPNTSKLPKEKRKLEYWAWNLTVNKDLEINPRYDRVEVYGVNAFKVQGGGKGLMLYFRPMGLSRLQSEKTNLNPSIPMKDIEINVYNNKNEKINIKSIQPVKEFYGKENKKYFTSYLLQIDDFNTLAHTLKIEVKDKLFNDKGEGLYFYSPTNYQKKINQ